MMLVDVILHKNLVLAKQIFVDFDLAVFQAIIFVSVLAFSSLHAAIIWLPDERYEILTNVSFPERK